MSIKTIFPFVFLSISLFGYSQNNYVPGYIITNKNDTIKGLIDFRTDHINNSFCKFKTSMQDSAKTYLPYEIAGYRLVNETKYYVSKTVSIDKVEHKLFLEYLVQGILNLYYLDNGNPYYIFEAKDGSMVLITKKQDEVVSKDSVKQDFRYKGLMSYVFRDDISLATDTKRFYFGRESMIEATKEYHNYMCESGDKCIIFANDFRKKFTKFDFTPYLGMELNSMSFYYLMPVKMNSFNPLIGGEFEVSSPRIFKPLGLTLGCVLSKFNGSYENKNLDSNINLKYALEYNKANINLGLKYIFYQKSICPEISFDYIRNYLFGAKSHYSSTYSNISEIIPLRSEDNTFIPFGVSEGLAGGVGVNIKVNKNNYLQLKLVYSVILNDYIYLAYTSNSCSVSTLQFRAGYRL